MEEMQIESPNLEIFTPKSDDLKYICSLSTILVATIQEVKDRVSQIELIFCSQLFPKFQSNSKSFVKKQEEWKEREGLLLAQIEELKCELVKEREERERLAREIERKDESLVAEQRKRKDAVKEFGTLKERYKSLKSQYTFLIGKLENNPGSFKLPSQAIEEQNSAKCHSAMRILQTEDFDEMETKICVIQESTSTPILPKPNSSRDEKVQSARTNAASSSKAKQEAITGQKRLATWRDTRTHQKPCGADPDPHDDFLDTQIESARKSRSNTKTESRTPLAQLHQDPGKKDGISLQDLHFGGSDEETQDLSNLNSKITIQKKEEKGYKFVEPVRKKGERENLKGVECKQCKKFYDAVLPDGKENSNNKEEGMRCEHQEGVSRHRYKYAPPLTPEGFWNIGFESEM